MKKRISSPGGRVPPAGASQAEQGPLRARVPGIALAAVVGAASQLISHAAPVLSALLLAIIVGIVAGNLGIVPKRAMAGLNWASKPLLRVGIAILGLQLSLGALSELGAGGIVSIAVTVIVTFFGTLAVGALMGVGRITRYLVSTGFAICGASAVAAMSAVVDPRQESEEETAQAIALVTLFGTVTLFALPAIAPYVGFNDTQMGIWIGASVHEVAQVVAAASAVSTVALGIATIAKLSRVVLLAPLIASVSVAHAKRHTSKDDQMSPVKRPPLVPAFVTAFLVAMLVRTIVPLPDFVLSGSRLISTMLLAMAMFALGVSVDVRKLIATGGKAALLGLVSTLIAVAVSYGTILLLT